MLRAIGAGCLIGATALLGERAARREQQRLTLVEGLLTALAVVEAEIEFLASDLADSFDKAAAAAPAVQGLFVRARAGLQRGVSAADAWRQAVAEWAIAVRLPRRQADILAGLAAAWGPWRAEDHCRHLRLAQTLLKREQEALRERLEQACRLWRYLGWSSGLLLALLLY